jgi:hypothetical protein
MIVKELYCDASFFLFIFLWENAAVLETGGGRSAVTRFESSEASMLGIVRPMSFLNICKMAASGC